jgi:RHS repeat-associated protein
LGNTRASFKADGNTLVQTAKTDFDPWGVILKSSQGNPFANRFELKEKERDLTFGLNWVNFGARRMNPSIGRMDNVDGLASKFSFHTLYNYALNNPLVIIDADGNESRDIWGNTTFNGFVGDDGSGNFVGTTLGDGGDKGKKKEGKNEPQTSREKALAIKGKGFWEFMNFAFSADGLTFLIDEIYSVEGSGKLNEKAHPAEKVNEITQNFAMAQVVGVIGKNFSLIKDSQLKKSGIDAHEIKKSWLGKNAKIFQFGLYKDTKTNEILILKKGGKGDPINTNIKMK